MKKIPLTQNKYALVDNSDFEELNKHKWYANKLGDTFYAMRHLKVSEGNSKTIVLMHSAIMKTPKGMDTDHKDRNGLNNQRKNLRICTRSQNGMNKTKAKANTSGFKGVFWHKRDKTWRSQIKVDGKSTHLGYFKTKEDAYKAYCEACAHYHGEFSNIK